MSSYHEQNDPYLDTKPIIKKKLGIILLPIIRLSRRSASSSCTWFINSMSQILCPGKSHYQ